ncbi:complement component C7 [Hyla sarda]|uniref:complement component C7 n=1 Tax=Hyla sarda TaxID=327740 RepID=UPI0024C2DA5E|nr:complement component C7 [Hyla sarda]
MMHRLLFLVLLLEIGEGAGFLPGLFSRSGTNVNCKWGPYGPWSECDGCTKTQTRRRTIEVYAQFGGLECTGNSYETQSCVPTKGCPIEDGCGDRFRCFSGQCISKALVCNGDHDCEEDSSDEANCEERHKVCDTDKYPPNTELTGLGFDVTTQKLKIGVIHTKGFGGKCRKVFSGDGREFYRLSQNLLTYTFKVQAKNAFSYDFYNSTWSYVKNTQEIVRSNYAGNKDVSTTFRQTKEKSYQFLVIRNNVEVAQFINNNPEHLLLAEPFWRELFNLPSVYDYTAYRKLIDRYGTHFLHSGSLGGEYEFRFYLDSSKETVYDGSTTNFEKCTSSSSGFLIFKSSKTECNKLYDAIRSSSGASGTEVRGEAIVKGGEPKFISALSYFSMDNPVANDQRYASWAGSVTNLPVIIKFKLAPLYELVKEVPCYSVKRLYLKRAIEEYLNEDSPCRCKPCQNKGLPLIEGTKCVCHCRPYTSGSACEKGILVDEQPGVIDGNWGCWTSWSTCAGRAGRRVRSRVCNNPAPAGGGKSCIGDSIESEKCEEDEIEHLRTVEPHCFDISILPTEFCNAPPPLQDGYIQDDDGFYHVGERIIYACNSGFTVVGNPIAECTDDRQWQVNAMQCQRILCSSPDLPSNIKAAPKKSSYEIGDKLKLSCPPALDLDGSDVIQCTSSLTWNPPAKSIQCVKKEPAVTSKVDSNCKAWEKIQDSKCTCKMPYECGSSLDICAIDGRSGKNVALTVCKMHALQCLGRKYTLTKDADCKFPQNAKRSCDSCHLWETCSGDTCVCREAQTCEADGISICVLVNGKKQTLSECDTGILKCQGEEVTIVSTSPCDV